MLCLYYTTSTEGEYFMNLVEKYKYFKKGSSSDFSAQNLSYHIFENIDFKQYFDVDKEITSFFRCDFRGSTFRNITFYKNEFDRADFISCTFIDCKFYEVNFGRSQTKDCYFYQCSFADNLYNTNTIQTSSYEDCEFNNEKILANINDCTYATCIFNRCNFDRTSADKLHFFKCKMCKINFATLHAENFTFDNCYLEDIDLGMPFVFGYFITNTSLKHVNFLYRGHKVSFQESKEYARELWSQNRYANYFNSHIILGETQKLPDILPSILNNIEKLSPFKQKIELQQIFDCIIYYMKHNVINFDCIYKIISYLEVIYNKEKYTPEIQMIFASYTYQIEYLLKTFDFSYNFYTNKSNVVSFVTFCCNTEDYDVAVNCTEKFVRGTCNKFGSPDSYVLYHSQKGSWLLTFAISPLIALAIIRIVKYSFNLNIELRIKNKLYQKLAVLLDQDLSIEDLNKITDVAVKANLIEEKENSTQLNTELESLLNIVRNIEIGL